MGFQDYWGNPITGGEDATAGAVRDFTEGLIKFDKKAGRVVGAAKKDPGSAIANAYAAMLMMFLEMKNSPKIAAPFLNAAEAAVLVGLVALLGLADVVVVRAGVDALSVDAALVGVQREDDAREVVAGARLVAGVNAVGRPGDHEGLDTGGLGVRPVLEVVHRDGGVQHVDGPARRRPPQHSQRTSHQRRQRRGVPEEVDVSWDHALVSDSVGGSGTPTCIRAAARSLPTRVTSGAT